MIDGGIMKETNIIQYTKRSLGSLRTATDSLGRPVVCLKDVCDILDIKNITTARKRLKSSGITKIQMATNGKPQNFLFITEGNLYRLILQSRKEEAEPFIDWVTEEVIPAIRKTGKYEVSTIMTSPEAAAALIEDHKNLLLKLNTQEALIESTKEARQFVYFALDSWSLVDLFDVPTHLKIEGINKNKMLEILRSGGILDDNNMPFQEYIDANRFRIMTFSYNDNKAGLKTNQRAFCYKSGINLILQTINKAGGLKK